MSISSRIWEMNNHLLADYEVLTLAGADLTGVNKNIVNLKMSWKERLLYFMNNGTDEVWNNWTKVSGTGTSLTLNNTEEAPMSLTYKGNTSQSGTPTPSSPIPINVVSGDNYIDICRKNLWGGFSYTRTHNGVTFVYNEDGTISCNGTATSAAQSIQASVASQYVKQLSAGTYYISGNVPTGIQIQTVKYDNGSVSFLKSGVGSFTIQSDTLVYIRIDVNSGVSINDTIKVQLEKSNQATTYEPYIGNTYPIYLGVENYFNSASWRKTVSGSGYPLPNDNYSTIISSDTNNIEFSTLAYGGVESDFIKVNENETYTLSFNSTNKPNRLFITQYDSSKNRVSTLNYTSVASVDTTTITTTQDGYIAIGFNNTSASSTNFVINDIQVVKGTKANHTSTTPIELCKIGTYQDKIFKNTPNTTDYDSNLEDNVWYLKKEIGKYTFTGNENWVTHSYGTNSWALQLLSTVYNANKLQIISNIFKGIPASERSDDQTNIMYFTNDTIIVARNTTFTAKADIQSATNGNYVYYALATPTYTQITDTTLLEQLEAMKQSYDSQTNISQTNNDLPFELNVTALEVMS